MRCRKMCWHCYTRKTPKSLTVTQLLSSESQMRADMQSASPKKHGVKLEHSQLPASGSERETNS